MQQEKKAIERETLFLYNNYIKPTRPPRKSVAAGFIIEEENE